MATAPMLASPRLSLPALRRLARAMSVKATAVSFKRFGDPASVLECVQPVGSGVVWRRLRCAPVAVPVALPPCWLHTRRPRNFTPLLVCNGLNPRLCAVPVPG